MRFDGEKLAALAYILGLVIIAAVVLTWVVVKKDDCESKGGKRLRGTWAWEQFECYDSKTLKILE